MSTSLQYLLEVQDALSEYSISNSPVLVGISTQVLHILGFTLLLSSVALGNLRLLGLTLKSVPVPDVLLQARRLQWIGLGLAMLSGSELFISFVKLYYFNPAFQLKIGLLLLAIVLQLTLFRRASASSETPTRGVKATAALSIALWFGIGLCGRAIGFV